MAKRVTNARVQVEESLSSENRVTNAKINVEQSLLSKNRVTKVVLFMEYIPAFKFKSSVRVQVI